MKLDPLEEAVKLKKALQCQIYGQNLAIDAVVDSVKNRIVDPKETPKHIYFFLGPPATGKTYMSQVMAQNFEGYSFYETSMSDYQTHNDGQNLFGTDKGYGTESIGDLTGFVRENPKTVILIDEFEKAHTIVQRKFLPMLSAGYLIDALGWIPASLDEDEFDIFNSNDEDHKRRVTERITKVDFTQTIVVFTSNLGSSLYNNQDFLNSIDTDKYQAESMILQELAHEKKREANVEIPAIVPEMLSRLSQGKIVLFNKHSMKSLREIAADAFTKQLRELTSKYDLKFTYNSKSIPFIQSQLLCFAPEIDARRVKAKIYEQFADKLTNYLLKYNLSWKDVSKIEIIVSKNVMDYSKKNIASGMHDGSLLKYLFRKNMTLKLTDHVEKKGDSLIYFIDNIEFKKVEKVVDTVGDGSISFEVPKTSFGDIDGHIEQIERLKEIANLLKNPDQLKLFDAKIPKGMLLYGKPGTGKTMMAKAFANYADLPFIETTANDLMDFANNDYSMMKKVFQRAKDYAPSIIFIDEIDTFGNRNDTKSPAAINELLTQINGFSDETEDNVFIIAATNYKEKIDEAILRAGRIELQVEVPVLDKVGRKAFMKKILKRPTSNDIDIEKLVMYTSGMTGAELEKAVNESSLYAIRNNLKQLTQEIVIEQINIEKYGKKVLSESQKNSLSSTAFHEAGHAVISNALMSKLKIEQVTITPRENALGFVSFNLENANANMSKKDMESQICIAFAGRMAQMKKYGDDACDTGAISDLDMATKLAYKMIAYYGMDKELGFISLQSVTLSDIQKSVIDSKVVLLLERLKGVTQALIDQNWKSITRVANVLLSQEVIHEEQLDKIMTQKMVS
ncbi:AAA family ATPase [Sulfurimonas aquatica]|uniref:AAA family ATPase n=1 Tax=Sulfurimonas aquatica TaxID=2672570 RepID=A0A975B0X5_9BACT|nr:AAA family ATPase [Sulfurimonas aquatica]QSZ42177.1 AAA family ATPase [Sulfurimonas aquatica]